MEKRGISYETFEEVIKELPQIIINMLPESPERLLPYAKRVNEIKFSSGIDDNVKRLMKEHLLSDKEYLKTFYYVFAITFYNKCSNKNPKVYVVSAQTGSGKSNLTAKLLREDENCIFVDSDKYKHFRFDARNIAENYQVLYPYLTGPDAYDQADNIYEYAIDKKYNIIKETAPSKNKGLLGVDQDKLEKKGYEICLHVLTVGKLNSLLSIHERYELQIIHGLKTAKLTPILRHNESYDALIPEIQKLIGKIDISIYQRGVLENNFIPVKIYPSEKFKDEIEAIEFTRNIDNEKTKEEFYERYNLIKSQMEERNALKEQFEQLENIRKEFLK